MDIILWPDDRLSKPSEPVTEFDAALSELVENMAIAMRKGGGIGLAAVQVGIHKRIFVMGDEEQYVEYINPKIVKKGDALVAMPEGCLSFPRIYDRIERPEFVQVSWQTRLGDEQHHVLTGIWARCFQHELDHLDGITFDSLMTPMAQKQLAKQARRREKAHG